jgi:nucleoside-diphosphate-sugar epimerase
MKTLIVGCGYLGTSLGKRLLSAGQEVFGLRRDPAALEGTGIKPVKADLTDAASLNALPEADWVVACQAPRRGEAYKVTYHQGTKNLVEALKKAPPKRLVVVSSTSVYSTADGSWVDEATRPMACAYASKEDSDNAHFLLGAEKAALTSGIPSMVIRLGGLYGPRRHRIAMLKSGKMTPSLDETLFTNRIRVEDAAEAVKLLLEKGEPGETYLGVDDASVSQAEFYKWLYAEIGVTPPPPAANAAPHGSNKRCSNKKLKALGFSFRYPDYRSGYAELLKEA